MTECTGAKRKIKMSKQVQEAYKRRHGITDGYYDYRVVPYKDNDMWTRYRKWVNDWFETCRAARGLVRNSK